MHVNIYICVKFFFKSGIKHIQIHIHHIGNTDRKSQKVYEARIHIVKMMMIGCLPFMCSWLVHLYIRTYV